MSRSIKKGPFVDARLLSRIEKMNAENKKDLHTAYHETQTANGYSIPIAVWCISCLLCTSLQMDFGIIRKKILKMFDIESEVFYADINWNELMRAIKNAKIGYAEISKYPAVKRDLALLVDKSVTFAEIEKIARETEKRLLKEVALFDVYEGKNLEPGKKSYAVSFILQDDTQTLNDKQIDKTMARLLDNFVKRLGAIQR